MRISQEAIYQALYVQGRGALQRELVACLRTGRALRVPRARSRQKAWAHVTSDVLISRRPAEVEDRAVPGHWEGDLIIGLERSAIGTLVEPRSTPPANVYCYESMKSRLTIALFSKKPAQSKTSANIVCPICEATIVGPSFSHFQEHVGPLSPEYDQADGRFTWECVCGPSEMHWNSPESAAAALTLHMQERHRVPV